MTCKLKEIEEEYISTTIIFHVPEIICVRNKRLEGLSDADVVFS